MPPPRASTAARPAAGLLPPPAALVSLLSVARGVGLAGERQAG